ncbi:U32 family peptidase [Reinekea thalattae]|uniref:Ubiquinone biosynthesis protein UbiV n=1 Tax=Reinekea thalattae TaxID=2593301 RepID=A0A5C8Z2F0_9GAMM|nr:U32 family peptidase [Reinekea thalattae]TXR51429.1 U32 family peptidase [Reinekea thalattae]
MQITLAPIPFYWPKETVFQFYKQAAEWPVDRICLGETICSKRRELRNEDWLNLAEQLSDAGKEVVMSTLALVEAESELKAIKSLCKDSDYLIEANDLAAAEYCFQQQKTFIGGPYLNLYNIESLKQLQADGMSHWTLPVELGQQPLQRLLTEINQHQLPLRTEVMVHGYLPLALSARCFTARAHEREKDACKKICIDYPTGIAVDNREQQRLFNLNGIQTQSGLILDLLDQVTTLDEMGVDSIRISPSQIDMEGIVTAYAQAIAGNTGLQTPNSSAPYCNGYWHGKEGMAHF